MGKWKPDGRGGKIFIGSESQHSTTLPSMKWLREQVPIRELIQMLGLKQRGKYVHCWHPEKHNHGDRTPSVGIDIRRNKVHCFACGFDCSTIDLVMDVNGLTVRQAAEWLASMWTSAGKVEQRYEVREGFKWIFPGTHRNDDPSEPMKTRKLTHEWSKLKPKHLKKHEKGYVEQLVRSRLWRTLTPATAKFALTLLTLTDPKMLTATISTRDLANLVGIRRSAVIRAARTIEQLGLYASETAYDKVQKKNKTKTYRLTWYSHAWQSWLKGDLRSTTTTKATSIAVSQTDQAGESAGGPQMSLVIPPSRDLLTGGSPIHPGQ